MRYSQLFGKTRKEPPKDAQIASHKLLVQGGFIHQTAAGIYSYLPLGFYVLWKVDAIIRDELARRGVQHMVMPFVHPVSLWKETGRREKMDDILATFDAAHGGEYLLAPTHEETVTDLARTFIESYRDLPVIVNQNQWKYRDELRVSGGLLRTREFLMQDAYSFDKDEDGMSNSFELMSEAYHDIFDRIGLDIIVVRADSGTMGGSNSEEFMVVSDVGEDTVFVCGDCNEGVNAEAGGSDDKCPKCKKKLKEEKAIELGHVFQLGTCYAESMGANFNDEDGKSKPLHMGCFGIGISRLVAAIAESSHDEKGIIWPESISPFGAHIVTIGDNEEALEMAEDVYDELWDMGIETLFDDREASAGEKLADADLIGIPHRIVISAKSIKAGGIEYKSRDSKDAKVVPKEEIMDCITPGVLEEVRDMLGGDLEL